MPCGHMSPAESCAWVCSRPRTPRPPPRTPTPCAALRATSPPFSIFCCFSGNVPKCSRRLQDRKRTKREKAALQKVERIFSPFGCIVLSGWGGVGLKVTKPCGEQDEDLGQQTDRDRSQGERRKWVERQGQLPLVRS